MNIIEKLKSLGVEVTPEIEKSLGGDFISIQEHEKKIARVEFERDKYKSDFDEASKTLDSFKGKDINGLEQQIAEWKKKAEDAKVEFENTLKKRDYSDAVKETIKDIKFSSNSAKKAFIAGLEDKPLEIKDGKLVGFDKYFEDYKKDDEGAFVIEDGRSQLTTSIHGSAGATDNSLAAMRAAMGLTNPTK